MLWRWLQLVGAGFPKAVEDGIIQRFSPLVPFKKLPSWEVLVEACAEYPFLREKSNFACTETLKVCLQGQMEELCRQIDVVRSLLFCLYSNELNQRTLPHLSATFYYTYKCLKRSLPEEGWLKEMKLEQILLGWHELQTVCNQPDLLFCGDGRIRKTSCWKGWHYRWPDDKVFESSDRLKKEIHRWLEGMLTYPHLRYWKDYGDWVAIALQEMTDSPMPPLLF